MCLGWLRQALSSGSGPSPPPQLFIGVIVAMLIFILKSSDLKIDISDVDDERLGYKGKNTHKGIKIVYLAGPLFFGTQEQLTSALDDMTDIHAVVFSMRGVPNIDDSAISELEAICDEYSKRGAVPMSVLMGLPVPFVNR